MDDDTEPHPFTELRMRVNAALSDEATTVGEPRPHTACFAPTTTLRWYQAPMTPEGGKVLQQLWVDVMAGAKEWREIETVDES